MALLKSTQDKKLWKHSCIDIIHSGSVPGAILAADVPAALAKLKAAVERNPDAPLNPATDDDEERRSQSVSLSHRAIPLIDLLEAAAREQKNVMWGD